MNTKTRYLCARSPKKPKLLGPECIKIKINQDDDKELLGNRKTFQYVMVCAMRSAM